MLNYNVAYLPKDKFEYLKYKLNSLRGRTVADDPVALSILQGDQRWIIMRQFVDNLPEWLKYVILAHEAGHHELDEWQDEEKVDLWALEALEEMGQEKGIKYMKKQWKRRHGHEFDERKTNV